MAFWIKIIIMLVTNLPTILKFISAILDRFDGDKKQAVAFMKNSKAGHWPV